MVQRGNLNCHKNVTAPAVKRVEPRCPSQTAGPAHQSEAAASPRKPNTLLALHGTVFLQGCRGYKIKTYTEGTPCTKRVVWKCKMLHRNRRTRLDVIQPWSALRRRSVHRGRSTGGRSGHAQWRQQMRRSSCEHYDVPRVTLSSPLLRLMGAGSRLCDRHCVTGGSGARPRAVPK